MPKASDDDSFGGSSYYAEMYVAGKTQLTNVLFPLKLMRPKMLIMTV